MNMGTIRIAAPSKMLLLLYAVMDFSRTEDTEIVSERSGGHYSSQRAIFGTFCYLAKHMAPVLLRLNSLMVSLKIQCACKVSVHEPGGV